MSEYEEDHGHASDLPTHATGVLNLFSTSRTGIDVFSDQVIKAVHDGEVNPLQVRVWLKTMEEIIDRVRKETNANQLREADKWSENKFEYLGATIEKADVKTEYDYSVCCDTVFERLEVEFNTAKQRLDDRKAFLKTLKAPMPIVDEDSGECVTIKPPFKKSTAGLKVSIR